MVVTEQHRARHHPYDNHRSTRPGPFGSVTPITSVTSTASSSANATPPPPRHAAGMTSPRELDAAIQSFAVPAGDPHDTCQETSATFTRHCHRHDIEARWLQLAGSPDLDLPPNSPWQGVPPSERHHYLTAIETTDADGAVREWFVCFTYRQFGSSKPMPWVTVNHGWAQSYDVTDSLDLLFPNP